MSDQLGLFERSALTVDDLTEELVNRLQGMDLAEQVEALNRVRRALHETSPFREEPVDLVQWLPAEGVFGNDYNPNKVAPPEMRLLEHSITVDGYTQPIVAHPVETGMEVVDGFHRHLVGRTTAVRERIHGYLPVTVIKSLRSDRGDRIAATIRHNRARGKHVVNAMSDIVADLVKRNWTDAKIARELGMDPDEVLRLKQVTGLAELFADREFSQAWEEADAGEE